MELPWRPGAQVAGRARSAPARSGLIRPASSSSTRSSPVCFLRSLSSAAQAAAHPALRPRSPPPRPRQRAAARRSPPRRPRCSRPAPAPGAPCLLTNAAGVRRRRTSIYQQRPACSRPHRPHTPRRSRLARIRPRTFFRSSQAGPARLAAGRAGRPGPLRSARARTPCGAAPQLPGRGRPACAQQRKSTPSTPTGRPSCWTASSCRCRRVAA